MIKHLSLLDSQVTKVIIVENLVDGFLIFNNLLEKTGIPFVLFKMGVKELIENKNKLKNLTSTDKKRLNKMLTDSKFSVFSDVISYMLENNVKLEQEILD